MDVVIGYKQDKHNCGFDMTFAKVEAVSKPLRQKENGKQEVRQDRRILPRAGLSDLLTTL
jgi:hypothetical protein